MVGFNCTYNKQFKSDSARLAFLVWIEFSDYGGQIKCRGRVLHTLIGRYAFSQTCKYGYFTYSVNITMYHLLKMRLLSLNRR